MIALRKCPLHQTKDLDCLYCPFAKVDSTGCYCAIEGEDQ